MTISNSVAIIGQGYVGLPLALSACKSGWRVYGIEIDANRRELLANGKSPIEGITDAELGIQLEKGSYSPTSDFELIRKCAFVVICVPTPLDENGEPDLTPLITTAQKLAPNLSDGAVVINESTSYPGTLKEIIQAEVLKISTAKNIGFAVSPERVDPGNKSFEQSNTPRIVSGVDQESLNSAANFYRTFCSQVVEVASPEIAEMAKLLENSFRLVNISMINEISDFCLRLGIDVYDVIAAAKTKPFGFMPFYPSLGIGGHCIPIDPIYLLERAKKYEVKLETIRIAKDVDERRVERIANEIFARLGKTREVTVVGLGYKPGTRDTRESASVRLIIALRNLGVIVNWLDSFVEEWRGEHSAKDICQNAILVWEDPQFFPQGFLDGGGVLFDLTGKLRNINGVISL